MKSYTYETKENTKIIIAITLQRYVDYLSHDSDRKQVNKKKTTKNLIRAQTKGKENKQL